MNEMLKPIQKLVRFSSSKTGSIIMLLAWVIAAIMLSVGAPGSKEYSGTSEEQSVTKDMPSETAANLLKEEFPTDEGLTALLVFHKKEPIDQYDREKISQFSKWMTSDKKPDNLASSLPFHLFPEHLQDEMFSEDKSTLIINAALIEGLDSDETNETLNQLREAVDSLGLDMQFEITGPAGISADTISIFRNADFILMSATIVLIFILLILIYRSPILAITPLFIAGIVYAIVDRLLGIAGKQEWFAVDGSAVSIMLVLLFAVLTDYSLFVFSRFREELCKNTSKYSSMQEVMHHVAEPILFSGGTVLLAMLTLFLAVFEPYNHFAPVFSVAVVVILLAGLTLIPSIFALLGRKAFWPFVPSANEKQPQQSKRKIWQRAGHIVTKKPGWIAGILLILFLLGAFNVSTMNYSFNLLKSFPDNISSRQGFELLEENYPPGQLAPVTVLLYGKSPLSADEEGLANVQKVADGLADQPGVAAVSPDLTKDMLLGNEELPQNFLSESKRSFRLQVVLDDNPYDEQALRTVEQLREKEKKILDGAGFSSNETSLQFAGQTSQQLDVQTMNSRDMIILLSVVTILLTTMLGFQTKSFILPIIMMSTILLSYFASLGFSWWIFENIMGYDAISYRIPVYTFVFMVALGIDYNIMLVSRIRERAKHVSWNEAVRDGVSLTGGVISSAGVILAATFAVLITQPLQELFLFGFTMALGILLDTFIIRGFMLPALLILVGNSKSGYLSPTKFDKTHNL